MEKPVYPAKMQLSDILSVSLKFMVFAALFAVTLELCARIDDRLRYGAPFWGKYSSERLRGRDNLGLSYNVPNARFEKWQHNTLGFRGPEVATMKKPGVLRVVCLGSSESYGLYESPGKEWPAQLRELLPDSRYEVINASVVGLNLSSFNAYLDKHVFPLDPDIVVLTVNPLFYVTSQHRIAQQRPKPATDSAQKSRPTPHSLRESLVDNLRVFPKFKLLVKQAVSENFPVAFKRYQISSTSRQVQEIERMQLRGRKPVDAVPESYLSAFDRELNGTINLIRSRNCEVILTSYPALISSDNFGSYPDIFLDNRRFCIELSLMGIVDTFNRFNSVTADVSRRQRAPFVDIQLLLPKSTEFFGDNVHYTDKGATVFAESVSRLLNRSFHSARQTQSKDRE